MRFKSKAVVGVDERLGESHDKHEDPYGHGAEAETP
jgi:hypothetical protein